MPNEIQKVSALRKGFGMLPKARQDSVLTDMVRNGEAIDDEGLLDVSSDFAAAAAAWNAQINAPTPKLAKGMGAPVDDEGGDDEDDEDNESDSDDEDDDGDSDEYEQKKIVKKLEKGISKAIYNRMAPIFNHQIAVIEQQRKDIAALGALVINDHKTVETMRKGFGITPKGDNGVMSMLGRILKGIGSPAEDFKAVHSADVEQIQRPGDQGNNERAPTYGPREVSAFARQKLQKGVSSPAERSQLDNALRELSVPGTDHVGIAKEIGYPNA
jgi:hypothetical protein